jgi:trehalose synthase-fused probable maltokinase
VLPRPEAIAAWISGRRWFATKTRRIDRLAFEDAIALGPGALVLARVTLDDGSADLYSLALHGDGALPGDGDAVDDPRFARALLDLVARGGRAEGGAGVLVARPTSLRVPELAPDAPVHRVGGEQSNTSVTYGGALILKLFRRLAPGVNPEEEITRFLTERGHFANAARLYGHLEYRPPAGPPLAVAVLQSLVPGARDGWEWMLAALARFRAEVSGTPTPERVRDAAGETLDGLRRLGAVTGALHGALAADRDDPAFAPEPISLGDLTTWSARIRAQVVAACEAAGDRAIEVAPAAIAEGLAGLRGRARIRHHGDFHLGQTLRRSADGEFIVIDFEGEPLRPLAERRAKHAAVRDVAGMLRSIGYAAAVALSQDPRERAERTAWIDAWEMEARQAFVAGYRSTTGGAAFLPTDDDALLRAVSVFEVEKAAYEIVYEANNRPEWIGIPRKGLARAAARLAAPRPTSAGSAEA